MSDREKRDFWMEHLAEEAERGRRAARVFPYRLVETTGERALDVWRTLKARRKGTPVVLGGDGDLYRLEDRIRWRRERGETADAVLDAADRIRFPDDLFALRATQREKARAWLLREQEQGRHLDIDLNDGRVLPPEGPWPDEVFEEEPLAVASDWDFGPDLKDPGRRVPLERVYIATLPGADPTEAPAHLHWGGWNDVPRSDMLVAALRSWRARYGAELVGMSHDSWSLAVAHPPQGRGEALSLAREMVALCGDLLAELETLQGQAALVMENDWWNFWWD